jgi:hypothetical protein
MKRLLGLAVMAAIAVLLASADTATPAKKKAPAKKGASTAAAKAPAKKAAAKGSPVVASSAHKSNSTTSHQKAPAKKATTWRNRQLSPTPERYHEIQDALVAKGYLKSEDANGTWNQTSVDALKKFQTEQNLDPSGKINSLSLIALGLGPKHDTIASAAPPKPQQ